MRGSLWGDVIRLLVVFLGWVVCYGWSYVHVFVNDVVVEMLSIEMRCNGDRMMKIVVTYIYISGCSEYILT